MSDTVADTVAVAVSTSGAVKEEETQPQKADESAASISENAPVGVGDAPPPEGSSKPKPEDGNNDNAEKTTTPSQNGKANATTPDDKAAEETSNETEEEEKPEEGCPPPPTGTPVPVVSSSKRSRPPYKYDINKITLRFLFANRDGLTVTVECNPFDTVGEVKGALLSVWPKDLPDCSGGDRVRLICMGKGILMPDSRTLEDCLIPVFKTHPTPVNVSVRPEAHVLETGSNKKSGNDNHNRRTASGGGSGGGASNPDGAQVSQGCACVIL